MNNIQTPATETATTYIAYKHTGKGWAITESLSVLEIGTKAECIKAIESRNEWCTYLTDEDSFYALLDGRASDAGFGDCSAHLQAKWLELKYGKSWEGEGFYSCNSDAPKYHYSTSFKQDIHNYYFTPIDELDEKELGALLNEGYSKRLDGNMRFGLGQVIEEIAEQYGTADDDGVVEIEAKDYDPKHSGYQVDARFYYYNKCLYDSYPETEEEEENDEPNDL